MRLKRQKTKDWSITLAGKPIDKLLKSVEVALRLEKDPATCDLRAILKELQSSPNRPSNLRKRLSQQSPTQLTIEEAVALMIDTNMSVSTYELLKQTADAHHFSLYPPYYQLRNYRVEHCRPKQPVNISDTSASISFQNLLDKTVSRVLQLQGPSLCRYAGIRNQRDL